MRTAAASIEPTEQPEADTLRVVRRAAPARRSRLDDMNLDPPSGPVPAEVIAYFSDALEREHRRRRSR